MNLKTKIQYYAAWVSYIAEVVNKCLSVINDIPLPQKPKESYNAKASVK